MKFSHLDQAEIKEEVKKCSNFDKLRKRFSSKTCIYFCNNLVITTRV